MEIPFRGQVDVNLLRRMNWTILAPPRSVVIIAIVVVLVMLWGVVFFPLLQGEPFSLEGLWPIFAFVLLFVGIFGYALTVGPKKVLQSNRLLQSPIAGAATEAGVRMETEHSRSEIPWDAFFKRKMGKDIVLLYQSIQVVNIFPREFFASEADWQAFVELVRERVPEKAPRSRGGGPSKLAVFLIWMVIFVIVILLWNLFQK